MTERADAHCHLDALSAEELSSALDARDGGGHRAHGDGRDGPRDVGPRAVDIAEARGRRRRGASACTRGWPRITRRARRSRGCKELARSGSVVAIGEIGLDFVENTWLQPLLRRPGAPAHPGGGVPVASSSLAQELELPVIIHSCGAHDAVTRILAEEGMGRLGGCVQFFEGTPEDVERYVELNFTFSIGSSVTYPDPGGWYDTVRSIPDEALLLETDAPWLPYDGAGATRSVPADLTRGRGDGRADPRRRRPRRSSRAPSRTCVARCRRSDDARPPAARRPRPRGPGRRRRRPGGHRGRISAVLGPGEPLPDAAEVHDLSGRWLMPGVVDTHVHAGQLRDRGPHEHDGERGLRRGDDDRRHALRPHRSRSWARERLDEKIAAGLATRAIVDVGLYGTMPEGRRRRAVLRELVEGGVCAFKFSLFEYDARRFPRIADGDLLAAFEVLARRPASRSSLHNELQEVVEHRLGPPARRPRGRRARARRVPPAGLRDRRRRRSCSTSRYWTGARLHLAHCTHPHTFRLSSSTGELGAAVSGETCVHYLAPERDGRGAGSGAIAKVNPPIRDEIAHEGLWALLREGAIASVSTDHAPWPIETEAPPDAARRRPGMPGLETLPAGHRHRGPAARTSRCPT